MLTIAIDGRNPENEEILVYPSHAFAFHQTLIIEMTSDNHILPNYYR
jgi:hypothetical protein